MFKGQKNRLLNKNICESNKLIKNKNIILCSKCNKYNTVIDNKLEFMYCLFCSNPNYIK